MITHVSDELFDSLRQLDTCLAADAIEQFGLRLRNEGFATSNSIHCRFPSLPAMLGYAVTLRVRSANPPMEGGNFQETRESWAVLEGALSPSVLVIQDMDRKPGVGAFAGELHAAILQKMGCVGLVTNGAVRHLPAVERRGLPFFSGSVSPSHAYLHIVDAGSPVEIGGLIIRPGDLLLGDCHGLVRIPPEIGPDLPGKAAEIAKAKRELLGFCDSEDFSLEEFQKRVESGRS